MEPTDESVRAARRPSRGVRRAGYLLASTVNLALLWLVNVSPGWRWVGFLTDDFVEVVGVVNLSLAAGVAVNLIYVAADPPWSRKLGDAATAAIACVVLARLWAVHPFALHGGWATWESPLRVAIGLLLVATALAVIANLVELIQLPAADKDEAVRRNHASKRAA